MRYNSMKMMCIPALVLMLVASTASAEKFTAKVVGVSDGDTLTVLTDIQCQTGADCVGGKTQYRVRLAEIDTPEKKQPFGSKSKQVLSGKVFGKTVTVEQTDKDRYGRLIGHIYLGDEWINASMVQTGSAWVYKQYATSQALFELENEARKAKRGLWALPEAQRMPPWEWRRM